MDFSSREIATAIIFASVMLLGLALSRDRGVLLKSLIDVARAFAPWKVWTVVLGYFVYLVCVVTLASEVGAWSYDLLKDTVVTGFFVGLPILFNIANFKNGYHVIRHVIKLVLGISALLAVYLNLAPFPLWGELILQTVLLTLGGLSVVAKLKPETASVGKMSQILSGLIGIGLLFHVTLHIILDFSEIDWNLSLRTFALSIWLPMSLTLFIYSFAFISACESALIRAERHNANKNLPALVKLAFVLGVSGRLGYVVAFTNHHRQLLAGDSSFREATRTMSEFRNWMRSNT